MKMFANIPEFEERRFYVLLHVTTQNNPYNSAAVSREPWDCRNTLEKIFRIHMKKKQIFVFFCFGEALLFRR